ncbi:MAG TPA: hypothetical protein VG795_13830 [Acidimicrobiia bacterium]|nr:hypothetical protein [Acidimicrobiia bacterium]
MTNLGRRAVVGLVAACLVFGSCESDGQTAKEESPTAPSTTATTSPPPLTPVVPPGFNAASVTFVSQTKGWVLGSATCGAAPCVQVWRTGDGGRTWAAVPAPPVPVPLEVGVENPPLIRFANTDDGWISADGKLWATHDGGAHWNEQSVKPVRALEASAGSVHAVVTANGQESFAFTVLTSPVDRDAWRPAEATVSHGAGPVPRAQLVLHGRSGWMVIVNRAIVGGLRLQNGRWVNWKPPCDGQGTPLEFAASTASDLVAFCTDGIWNDRPPGDRVFVSTDGGSSFRQVPSASPVRNVYAVAAATPDVWVAGSTETNAEGQRQAVLLRTTDAGRIWTTVHRAGESNWLELGMTTAQQGVVIDEGEIDKLFMTYDGGQTWTPVEPH